MTTYPRRRVLKSLCQASLVTMLPGSMQVYSQAKSLKTLQLNSKMSVIQGPKSNVMLVSSDDGPIVVDGGEASWSDELLTEISRVADGRPVRTMINTHWHPEQTGLNHVLGERGTEIIAHDNTRQWLTLDVHQRWSGITYRALPDKALPNSIIYDSSEKHIGEHMLQLGYLLHAHTDGDIYVHLPEANVLFAGGFLTSDTWPLIDWWTGGWSGGLLNAFDSVLPVCNDETIIIPSSGAPMTLAELTAQREMYLSIFEKVHAAFAKSMAPDEIVAMTPAAGLKSEWGSPDLMVKLAAESLKGHVRDGVGNWLPLIP